MAKEAKKELNELPRDLQKRLKPFLSDYKKRLQEGLNHILNINEIQQITPSENSMAEMNRFNSLFFEFTNILRATYAFYFKSEEAYKLPISKIVSDFNNEKAIKIPVDSSRVKEVLDRGHDILSDAQANNSARLEITKANINIQGSTVALLDFIFKKSLSEKTAKPFEYHLYDGEDLTLMFNSFPLSIRFASKFRPQMLDDLKEIAIDALETLRSSQIGDRKICHFLVIFTNIRTEEFAKITFNIKSSLLEHGSASAHRVGVSIISTSNLPMLNSIITTAIEQFTYQIKLQDALNFTNGWKGSKAVLSTGSMIQQLNDPEVGECIEIKMPNDFKPSHHIEYIVGDGQRSKFTQISIAISAQADHVLYVAAEAEDIDMPFWFQMQGTVSEADKRVADNEYKVYIRPIQMGKWKIYNIELPSLYHSIFEQRGKPRYKGISRIRFRGHMIVGWAILF